MLRHVLVSGGEIRRPRRWRPLAGRRRAEVSQVNLLSRIRRRPPDHAVLPPSLQRLELSAGVIPGCTQLLGTFLFSLSRTSLVSCVLFTSLSFSWKHFFWLTGAAGPLRRRVLFREGPRSVCKWATCWSQRRTGPQACKFSTSSSSSQHQCYQFFL